jgi:hypothetical protein
VIAADIVEDLRTALEQLEAIAGDLSVAERLWDVSGGASSGEGGRLMRTLVVMLLLGLLPLGFAASGTTLARLRPPYVHLQCHLNEARFHQAHTCLNPTCSVFLKSDG